MILSTILTCFITIPSNLEEKVIINVGQIVSIEPTTYVASKAILFFGQEYVRTPLTVTQVYEIIKTTCVQKTK